MKRDAGRQASDSVALRDFRYFQKSDSMDAQSKSGSQPDEKATITLPGTVEKNIPAIGNREPEKAQIAVDGADDRYREIRIENTLQDKKGKPAIPKVGSEVEVETTERLHLRCVLQDKR